MKLASFDKSAAGYGISTLAYLGIALFVAEKTKFELSFNTAMLMLPAYKYLSARFIGHEFFSVQLFLALPTLLTLGVIFNQTFLNATLPALCFSTFVLMGQDEANYAIQHDAANAMPAPVANQHRLIPPPRANWPTRTRRPSKAHQPKHILRRA